MVSRYTILTAMVISAAAGNLDAGETILLDFQADWCMPCRQTAPLVDALIKKGYPVRRVDIDREPELARKYRVGSIPCFVMLVDGKEVDRAVGGATTFTQLEQMCRTAASKRSQAPISLVSTRQNATVVGSRGSIPPSTRRAAPFGSVTNARRHVTDEQLLSASVRIRVEDADGYSCGSGTIIDARDGAALVLTCGHIFRDSSGKGRIDVDLFGPNGATRVEGRLISYDAEYRDIGLISIRPSGPVMSARVAPAGHHTARSELVATVGCSHGERPTVEHSRITSINKFQGSPNVQVAGQPVEGRSGGGLFSSEGLVIGVCNAADPSDREGLYAALATIHAELDRAQLAFVHRSPRIDDTPRVEMVAVSPPPMSRQAPASLRGPNETIATASATSPLNREEQAALAEILRRLKDGAEVLCIVRSRGDPSAQSEIIVLDRASPEFLRQLAAQAMPQATGSRDIAPAASRELIPTSRKRQLPIRR